MYKRKAQVVFLDRTGKAAAPLAAKLAGELGADWLEARAAALEPASTVAPLDEAVKHWADLLVHFDEATGEAAKPLPPTTRLKYWPLKADPETDSAQLLEELRQRVNGMIGGMRMLSRLSPDEDD